MTRFLLAASAAAMLGIAPAMAQNPQTTGHVNSQDRTFVQTAAQGNEAEIEAGKLAEERAATPAVREFGRWMVTDHTMLNKMLHAAAKQEGVEISTSPNQQQQQQMSNLRNEQGVRFDRTYIDAQVQDHEKTIAAFRQEANDGENAMLKQQADGALPMLEQHLKEARDLQKTPGNNSVASTETR